MTIFCWKWMDKPGRRWNWVNSNHVLWLLLYICCVRLITFWILQVTFNLTTLNNIRQGSLHSNKERKRPLDYSWQAVSRCANDILMVVDFYYNCFELKTLTKNSCKIYDVFDEKEEYANSREEKKFDAIQRSKQCTVKLTYFDHCCYHSCQNCIRTKKKLYIISDIVHLSYWWLFFFGSTNFWFEEKCFCFIFFYWIIMFYYILYAWNASLKTFLIYKKPYQLQILPRIFQLLSNFII